MTNALNTRLSRLEGRSGTGAVILAVFDHDEAEKVREVARAHGEISPLIVVTGVPRPEPLNLGSVREMLHRVAREGRPIHGGLHA